MNDPVNHPAHYNSGKIEVLDFILDQKLNYLRGHVVRYVSRAGKKETADEIEDLEKAYFYLAREIREMRKARLDEAANEDRDLIALREKLTGSPNRVVGNS